MGQRRKNLFREVIEPEIDCQREREGRDADADGEHQTAGGGSVRSGGKNAALPRELEWEPE